MAHIEVNDLNEVRIWVEDYSYPGGAPNLYQPTWPDGTPWNSKEEAEAWAQAYVTAITDETAPLPGDNPAQPTRERTFFVNPN